LKFDPLLTEAFHIPVTLASRGDFVAANHRFSYSTLVDSPFAAPRALVIGWKTTKNYLIWLILVLCLLSLAAGIFVGMLCHNAGLGVAVTSGVAAVLSAFEVLMLLQVQ
jgi:hypothetical protein